MNTETDKQPANIMPPALPIGRPEAQKSKRCISKLTLELRSDARCQTESTKSIVEYFVGFERCRSTIGDFNSGCLAIKHPVKAQSWVALVADEHTGLRIAEYVVMLNHACTSQSQTDTHHQAAAIPAAHHTHPRLHGRKQGGRDKV